MERVFTAAAPKQNSVCRDRNTPRNIMLALKGHKHQLSKTFYLEVSKMIGFPLNLLIYSLSCEMHKNNISK